MIDLTYVIEAVLLLVIALITAFLIPYIRSRTTASQRETMQAVIYAAVAAAEKLFPERGSGDAKKSYVLTWLEERGYTYDADEVAVMLESAVLALELDKAAVDKAE